MKDIVAQVGNLIRSFRHRLDSEKSLTPSIPESSTEFLADIKQQSVVGIDVAISGDLICQDNINIDGQLKGCIKASKNAVVIAASGLADGDIVAKNLLVKGKVVGNVSVTETIYIAKTGTIIGNLQAAKIELENGAKYKGVMQIDPIEQPVSAQDSSADNLPSKSSVSVSTAMEPS